MSKKKIPVKSLKVLGTVHSFTEFGTLSWRPESSESAHTPQPLNKETIEQYNRGIYHAKYYGGGGREIKNHDYGEQLKRRKKKEIKLHNKPG